MFSFDKPDRNILPPQPSISSMLQQSYIPELPPIPTPEEIIAKRWASLHEPLATQRVGPMKQFMYGLASPVTGTLGRLGLIDKSPKPVTIGETIAHAAGGLISWIALGIATQGAIGAIAPSLGGGLGTAATAIKSAGSISGAMVAPALRGIGSAGAKSALQMIGSGLVSGGMYGAHSAWVEEDPIAPGVLQGMAFGGAMGLAGLGVSKAARKIGMMRTTTAGILEARLAHKPILHTADAASMAQSGKLGQVLAEVPDSRMSAAVEEVMERARLSQNPLPSKPGQHDIGITLGSSFDTMNPHNKAVALVEALHKGADSDTILEPVFDIYRAVQSPKTLLKGNINNYAKSEVRDIIFWSKATPIDVTPRLTDSMATPYQRGQLVAMSKAKTLGEQYTTFEKLRRNLTTTNRKVLKDFEVQSFKDLSRLDTPEAATAIQDYVNRVELIQDLTWQLGDRVSKVAHKHPSVDLPSLHAVQDSRVAKTYLKVLKTQVERDPGVIEAGWHEDIHKIFVRANEKTGKSFMDPELLPPEFYKEFQDTVARLKDAGDNPRIILHNLITFPIPEDLAVKDIPDFILKSKALPSGSIYQPLSLHESLTLRHEMFRPFPLLGRLLTPVRHALGEGFTNNFRTAVQGHQKFMDVHKGKVAGWLKLIGGPDKQETTKRAVALYEFLSGKVPDSTASKIGAARERLFRYRSIPSAKVLDTISRHTGLHPDDLKEVWHTVYRIQADPSRLASFTKQAKATGVPLERYAELRLLNHSLRRTGAATGPQAEGIAKLFGLKNSSELRVAFEMRTELDKVFRSAGLDPDLYLPGYMPRFRKFEGKNYDQIIDSLRSSGVKENDIKGYLWMNELSRTAKGTGYTYETDAFRAYTRYMTGYSKSVHFGDDFFEPYVEHFQKMGIGESRMAVLRDLRHWVVGRPGEVEQEMDRMINGFVDVINQSQWKKYWGHRPSAELSSLLAELQFTGALGFNPFTAIKNLTQKGLALSSITDDGNPLHGLYWMFKARKLKRTPEGKYYLSNCAVLHNRNFGEGLEMQYSAMENLLRRFDQPWLGEKAHKFRDNALAIFRKSDLSNVEDTWLSRFLYLTEAKKAPWSDAINLATQTTMATQFMYGIDSPMLYKSPLGKQIGLFMSWPLNWSFLLYNQGTSGDIKRAISTVVTMAVGAELLTMTGLNFMSIHPVNTARGLLPLALLSGEESWPIAMRSSAGITQYMRALTEGNPEAIDAALQGLSNRLWPLVPAGVMTNRALNFIDVARNDWRKYDSRGRMKYEVGKSEALRSMIGPTTESFRRSEDWGRIARMEGYYRNTRKKAINAFLNQDYDRFQKLQEQLMINFGKYIEPKDIQYELRLQEMTSRERQLISLPTELRDPYLARYRQ